MVYTNTAHNQRNNDLNQNRITKACTVLQQVYLTQCHPSNIAHTCIQLNKNNIKKTSMRRQIINKETSSPLKQQAKREYFILGDCFGATLIRMQAACRWCLISRHVLYLHMVFFLFFFVCLRRTNTSNLQDGCNRDRCRKKIGKECQKVILWNSMGSTLVERHVSRLLTVNIH